MLTICCEKCGAGVSVDPGAMPKKIKCPQCHAKVKVPEGLAALPTPKVPGAAGQPAGTVPPPPPGVALPADLPAEESEAAVVMAKLMPWLASACLHGAAVLLVLLISGVAGGVTKKEEEPKDLRELLKEQPKKVELVKVPEKLVEGAPTEAKIKTGGMGTGTAKKVGGKRGRTGAAGWYGDPGEKAGKGWGHLKRSGPMDVWGGGSGGGGGAGGTDEGFGMGRGAGGEGGGGFFGEGDGDGTGGNVKYVIYCIDHSGSVLPEFDRILEELKSSIGGLVEAQEFHVVFFAKDTCIQNPARRLVAATDANKREALKFLQEIRAAGWGSSPIPALKAAFDAFKDRPDKEGEGKLVYLLTDGDFETSGFKYKGLSGNEAVTVWLRDYNADKMVHVFPIILACDPSTKEPSKETEESMRKIATENGGEYRFVKQE